MTDQPTPEQKKYDDLLLHVLNLAEHLAKLQKNQADLLDRVAVLHSAAMALFTSHPGTDAQLQKIFSQLHEASDQASAGRESDQYAAALHRAAARPKSA